MKALTQRALTGGLAVLLSACASYPHQTYYPATGAYTHYEGYSVIQQSYYGGYPVRYDSYSFPSSRHHHFDHPDHRSDFKHPYNSSHARPLDHNIYAKPGLPNHYNQYHSDRIHKEAAYQAPASDNEERRLRAVYGDNRRGGPSFHRPGERREHKDYLPHSNGRKYGMNRDRDGQNPRHSAGQKKWDAKDQRKEQRRFEKENVKISRNEIHESAKAKRKRHHEVHKEHSFENQRHLNEF